MGIDLFATAGGRDAAGAEARLAAELIVTGIKAGETGTVAIDDYIRFSFESPAGTAGAGTVAIADGDSTLVEIGIDLATGRLRGATLVSFGRRAKLMPVEFLSRLPMDAGLPVLAAGGFDTDVPLPRIVLARPVEMWRGETAAIVQIGVGTPDRAVRCGAALFLVARDALWGFGADGLASDDVARMAG